VEQHECPICGETVNTEGRVWLAHNAEATMRYTSGMPGVDAFPASFLTECEASGQSFDVLEPLDS
jgi:hypothetical protein